LAHPEDPLETARAALAPGETLVWADRPDPQALARARLPQLIRGLLGLAVIAGFLWLSFAPNWPGGLRGLLFAVFLAVVTLYSLWLLAAPLVARQAAGRTVYAVTDRRLIIFEDWPRRRLRSFAPAELDYPVVAPAAPGPRGDLGSVVFIHRKLPWWQRSAGGSYRIEAFYGIADAQRVAERVDALKQGGASPSDEAP
jgi:hypothetical protein